MSEILKSILMGLGCLSILSFVGCGMMGAGVIVAADRAADRASHNDTRDSGEKSPWDK
ncbi:MAG: hypothetical protein LCH74_17450 [Proteobacteria bacterium]|nr:hypothetical protein [Pseudomonadota bacterium]